MNAYATVQKPIAEQAFGPADAFSEAPAAPGGPFRRTRAYKPDTSLSRRLPGLAIVGLVHVAAIYGLVVGLSHGSRLTQAGPIAVRLIDEVKPVEETRAPPPPKFAPPPPAFVPLPDITVREAPSANAIALVTTARPGEPPPAPPVTHEEPKAAVIVPAVIDPARTCEPPIYPLASRDAGEEGSVFLLFLIDTDGHVMASRVERSSGHTRLDDAALATLSKCRFVPATIDGKPQQTKARLRYNWRID